MIPLRIRVVGTPAVAGSKKGFPIRAKGGKIVGVRVTDDSKKSKPWQAAVRAEAADAMDEAPLLRGPLAVAFAFYVRRPKGHYGARGLRPSAPLHPTVKPDVLKLARAVEDALTGVVWADDAQIVSEQLTKAYGEPECVVIEVRDAAIGMDGSAALPLWREGERKLRERMAGV